MTYIKWLVTTTYYHLNDISIFDELDDFCSGNKYLKLKRKIDELQCHIINIYVH